MRAWFRELSPARDGADSVGLDEFNHLSKELQSHLRLDLPDGEPMPGVPSRRDLDRVLELQLAGRPLGDLATDFEKLQVMDNVWTRRRLPSHFRNVDTLTEWTSVFDFASRKATDLRVFELKEDVLQRLGTEIALLGEWRRRFRRVIKDAAKTRERFGSGIESAMRDLGLVRWGYVLSEKQEAELLSDLNALLAEDQRRFSFEAANLVQRMTEARTDPALCQVVCATLWAIGCYGDLVSLVDECEKELGEVPLPISLISIRAGAQARAGRLSTRSERQAAVTNMVEFLAKLPPDDRRAMLLGAGYVVYHAWRMEWLASGLGVHEVERLDDSVREWARISFTLGEEAYDAAEPSGLQWAFATNHCAYVGAVTKVETEKTDKYLDLLLRLDKLTDLWNARFADTAGTYYLIMAERVWHETPPDQRSALDLRASIERAKRYFESAQGTDVGDIDIEEHLSRLEKLRADYEEVLRSVAGSG
jgi:hypothetical protein